MKRFLFTSKEDKEPSVDLTPLIDVVFVILMTFMVSVPFIRLDSIALSPSTTKNTSTPEQKLPEIILRVSAEGAVTVNDQPADIHSLSLKLKSLKQQHPLAIPLLLHDEKASFGTYRKIKDQVEAVGFKDLHVALRNS
ncbi:ExbD/TolR family protein [Chlamydiifrater phoenicopteri]|uniref:ExbD/TolR family protein n=1 Tax=Chlamydiifrater phoenicopteri TaxID=2681469 RepID=UPI001BD1636E|nr:biopolymer transporter ExbD [Chlamydiifrater phoenicopteri]